jgi:wobble nucleotide-excising tRNase
MVKRQIKESDWKLFRQVRVQALERFCERILLEVERINSDRARGFHEKYLDVWRVLKRRDKELAQAFDDIRRSTAWSRLASMKVLGLLTEDELRRFSQETREVVDLKLET